MAIIQQSCSRCVFFQNSMLPHSLRNLNYAVLLKPSNICDNNGNSKPNALALTNNVKIARHIQDESKTQHFFHHTLDRNLLLKNFSSTRSHHAQNASASYINNYGQNITKIQNGHTTESNVLSLTDSFKRTSINNFNNIFRNMTLNKNLSLTLSSNKILIRSMSTETSKQNAPKSDTEGTEKTHKTGQSTESDKLKGTNTEVKEEPAATENLSDIQKLKRAIVEYGSMIVVFHIGVALLSLGSFYLLVSNGVNVLGLIEYVGLTKYLPESVAVGGSTFIIAYGIHKMIVPVRMAITLTCAPIMVRYLRKIGVLKPPKVKKP